MDYKRKYELEYYYNELLLLENEKLKERIDILVYNYKQITDMLERLVSENDTITDDFGNYWSKYCSDCGSDMEVVRPGKVQCSKGCHYDG